MRLLIVTAVAAEGDAILHAVPAATGLTPGDPARDPSVAAESVLEVVVGGVGAAAAAAATATALSAGGYDLVLSAGIAGGFAPLEAGSIAVASACEFGDLGAETDGGFVPVSDLGLGTVRYEVAPRLALELTDLCGAHLGTILTVGTVTGTAATAAARLQRCPDAVAEAMEGAGVALASSRRAVPFGEIRAISNAVGPRERSTWRVPEALAALGRAVASIVAGQWQP